MKLKKCVVYTVKKLHLTAAVDLHIVNFIMMYLKKIFCIALWLNAPI